MSTLLRSRWGLLRCAFLLLCGFALSATTFAQDRSEKKREPVRSIEIRDGKVFINGEEIDPDADAYYYEFSDDDSGVALYFDDDGRRFHVRRPGTWHWDNDDEEGGMRSFSGVWSAPHIDAMDLSDRLHTEIMALHDGPGLMMRMEGSAELRRMERDAHRLAREARRAQGEERDRLEAELREKLEAIFDEKLNLQVEQTERLQERLSSAQERLETRRSNRAEIIERRQRQLLGERDVLEW